MVGTTARRIVFVPVHVCKGHAILLLVPTLLPSLAFLQFIITLRRSVAIHIAWLAFCNLSQRVVVVRAAAVWATDGTAAAAAGRGVVMVGTTTPAVACVAGVVGTSGG